MAQSKTSKFFSRIGVAVLNGLSRLPMAVHYKISDWVVYPLVYHVARYRRKVVRKNLQLCFPDKTEAERLSIERNFYHYMSDLAVEIVKVHSISADEILRRVEYVNLEEVEASLRDHDFALCYLSHFGNWEWLIALPLLLNGYGECQIYHPMRNKVFDRWFLENRSRFGAVNIKMKETLRKLMTIRQENHFAFGCIADQLPKKQNVHHTLQFLGNETKVFTGSEQLGRKLNMSFFYCKMTRPERGRYVITMQRLDTGAVDPDASEFAYTDEYFRRFEQDVREHPELWLWTHDRWKR
ncbi:MAG: lysophospholipid acyltransferase family protein [Bacteroidales bacterium]|nr:lysophospholipid acyltransferase family protein [Bacteroidales bacterium]